MHWGPLSELGQRPTPAPLPSTTPLSAHVTVQCHVTTLRADAKWWMPFESFSLSNLFLLVVGQNSFNNIKISEDIILIGASCR